MIRTLAAALATTTCLVAIATPAAAQTREFNVSAGSLRAALDVFARQSGRQVIYQGDVRSARSPGVRGAHTADEALDAILAGTGFAARKDASGAFAIVKVGNGPTTADRVTSSVDAPKTEPQDNLEIIVTAQKRSERLFDTPQSVSVLSGSQLERMGATKISDWANTVPGLNFTTFGAGQNQLSLRGVTAGSDLSPTVGMYLDDVPIGDSSSFARGPQLALDAGLFDIQQIEVLRGPQGTLYGASTMGGLIKYVTRPPNLSSFGVDVLSGLGTINHGGEDFDVSATLNAPLAPDVAAIRASGYYSHEGGFIDDPTRGRRDINRANIYGGRADVLIKPSNTLSIRISGFLQNISRDGEGLVDYTFTGHPAAGDLEQIRFMPEPFEQSIRLLTATVEYDFGGAKLTSISSYQRYNTNSQLDFTALFAPILTTYFLLDYGGISAGADIHTKVATQEVRLASSSPASLEWLVGGFYTHQHSELGIAFNTLDPAGQPVPNNLGDSLSHNTLDEYAIFGDLTAHLSKSFDVTGGIRYAKNDQRSGGEGVGLFVSPAPSRSSSDTSATFLANARYQFSPHLLAYARFATGYRPGGTNSSANDPITGVPLAPPTFKPDKLQSYELGVRAETSDRRFAVDGAIYHINWDDIQVAATRNGFFTIVNLSGGAKIDGAELSVTALPFDGLTLSGALGYQNPRTKEAEPDLGAAKGERLPNVAHFTASLNADYLASYVSWRPTVGATLRYVSNRQSSFDESLGSPQYHLPEYALVDLRAGGTLGIVDAQLFVHNVFDKRAQLSAGTDLGVPRVAIVQPRTFGAKVGVHF